MKRGFYTIMAAQFFSSLADTALLFVAIAILVAMEAPPWLTPMLKWSFTVFYVLLAAFVGAFADALPKGRVMFIANLIKIFGCSVMLFGVHPLLAYAIVGLGAAVYSPAKYGILTELLPAEKLVAANGWIEGLTVTSIVFGTVLGGLLVGSRISSFLLGVDFPLIDTAVDTPAEAALSILISIYLLASLFNLKIPLTGARYGKQAHHPSKLIADFANCCAILWRDKLGQVSLAITTLIWGAAAAMQLIVVEWAQVSLKLNYEHATRLVGVFAVGMALGAVASARTISLQKSLSVLPVGIAMGVVVIGMTLVQTVWMAIPVLILIGALGGFYIVPMNALLQHRGHILMSAGHSIAVQNFNENLSILSMLAIYALMIRLHLPLNVIILLFGLALVGSIYGVMRMHARNQSVQDSLALIGEHKH